MIALDCTRLSRYCMQESFEDEEEFEIFNGLFGSNPERFMRRISPFSLAIPVWLVISLEAFTLFPKIRFYAFSSSFLLFSWRISSRKLWKSDGFSEFALSFFATFDCNLVILLSKNSLLVILSRNTSAASLNY